MFKMCSRETLEISPQNGTSESPEVTFNSSEADALHEPEIKIEQDKPVNNLQLQVQVPIAMKTNRNKVKRSASSAFTSPAKYDCIFLPPFFLASTTWPLFSSASWYDWLIHLISWASVSRVMSNDTLSISLLPRHPFTYACVAVFFVCSTFKLMEDTLLEPSQLP